jgi:molybdate transport system ATP-binding protein
MASSGRITQAGRDITALPPAERDFGIVFQSYALFPNLNVAGNIGYGLRGAEWPREKARARVAELIATVGLEEHAQKYPSQLSGGQQQRVALARALANRPGLLLLDEPLASLDIARRQEIMPWLERLHTELSIPVLYVTHSMEELTRLADYVVLLNNGQVSAQGSIAHVLSDSAFARELGSDAGAVLTGHIAEHDNRYHLTGIDVNGARLWVRQKDLAIGSAVRVHIHASDVSLALTEPKDSSIQNKILGVIESIADDVHPASCLVAIRCQDQRLLARVTRKALANLELNVGAVVWAQIKSVALA